MNKKNLLAIYLNEFDIKFLQNGAKKFKCANIQKFLRLQKCKTYSPDKVQDKNLDPWVQSVSINTGKRSSEHKIFKIGQKIKSSNVQIWDNLSKRNISCGVWGAMNSKFKKNKNLKIYFPDPWNNFDKPFPENLNYLFKLPRSYAQNYTNFSIFSNFKNISLLIIGIFKFGIFNYLTKKVFFYLKIFFNTGIKNYFLFFLLDIFSLVAYAKIEKKNSLQFSLIFLNSIAHYQHNNWDEKKNHWKFFLLVDEMFRIINKIYSNYNSLIIFNGFTQKKIKPEYIIRANDFGKFFKDMNIRHKSILPNMTNGGFLAFDKIADKKQAIKILKNYNLFSLNVFEIKSTEKLVIFFRIQIKSYKNLRNFHQKVTKNNFKKYISYEKNFSKYSIYKKNDDLFWFVNRMTFIKTTGKHIPEGDLIFDNMNIHKNKIENKEIFKIIERHF